MPLAPQFLKTLSVIGFAIVAIFGSVTSDAHAEDLYREPYRPQFHFTPERNWMNDPNGMVFYDGEYHLFYQYNPFGDRWGHMSWGHAVSKDMLHWEHLPLALAEEDGVMIFSGSAVVDWKNTSGFGKDGKPPLIAIYTGHRDGRQDQRIAYSNDRGRTWTRFEGNPVLDLKMADFRDPKVFWHEPSSRWIMTVSLSVEKKVHFYASTNLKEWKYTGEFGPAGSTDGLWECPDLFSLPIEGGGAKWGLIVNINPGGPAGGSACQYFIGEFDGSKFVADSPSEERAEFVPDGRILADFENGYDGWRPEGKAFGNSPAAGTLPNQQPVTGFRGHGLVNSYFEGDGSVGRLISPEFEIDQRYLSFLIGGGAGDKTRLELHVDGKVVRTANGRDREQLAWQSWDLGDLLGRQAQIQIVDEHDSGWGHINVDHILLADKPARPADESALWADYGADFYAAVSWSDIPENDGRRLWLGWMSNWQYANDVPTSPWRSAMSIPRELGLINTPNGFRLVQKPVRELASLRKDHHRFDGGTVAEANTWLTQNKIDSEPRELSVMFAEGADTSEGVKLFQGDEGEATIVSIDRQRGIVSIDRTHSGNVRFHDAFPKVQTAPLSETDKPVRLRIFVDACSVEVFVNEGEQVLTSLTFPSSQSRHIEFFGPESDKPISSVESSALKSVWKSQGTVER